jgi:hypothetical protein
MRSHFFPLGKWLVRLLALLEIRFTFATVCKVEANEKLASVVAVIDVVVIFPQSRSTRKVRDFEMRWRIRNMICFAFSLQRFSASYQSS